VKRTLVLDTSAVLNLLACGAPSRFMQTLGSTFVVPHQVVAEIVQEPKGMEHENESLAFLLKSRQVLEHRLAGGNFEAFIELAAAPSPDGLDDGEAAAIAAAEELACSCVIDERKATRIAVARRPHFPVLSTVDLFVEAHDRALFDAGILADFVYRALSRARMRVLDKHGDWVVALIGRERANSCASLSKILRHRA